MSDFHSRFERFERLYNAAELGRLRAAHVCVVGLGGVGSWAVEALARSGIGRLTLVDMDTVLPSNTNRQLCAVQPAMGRPKAEVMAERVRSINPECEARPVVARLSESTAIEILGERHDFVVDAIDDIPNKCLLIARCRWESIPLVTSGGAGGRQDPAAVRCGDLAFTGHDGLLRAVRKRLRDEYGFPRDPRSPFGITAIFSTEPQAFPQAEPSPGGGEAGPAPKPNGRNYGTAAFVTGVFGLFAAAQVVSALAQTVAEE